MAGLIHPAVRWQFSATLVLGGVSAVLAVLTLIAREWIEIVFGVEPDRGSGSLEWAIVVITAVTAIVCLGYARVEWRRARVAEVTGHG
jgi:hypothetical protein